MYVPVYSTVYVASNTLRYYVHVHMYAYMYVATCSTLSIIIIHSHYYTLLSCTVRMNGTSDSDVVW